MEKPKRKTNRVLVVLLGLLAILLLFLLALFALYSINRSAQAKKDFNSRPLVLIHAPLNHEMVETGEMVTVHATARETSVGLQAVELWVNDVRVAEWPAAEGKAPQSLLLMENWVPTVPGSQVVIVRATAANGVLGQAMVVVEVQEGGGPGTGVYPVEEGDTLVSIADEVGTTPEELAGLNPDLGGVEPNPGDDLVIPGTGDDGGDRDGDGGGEPGGGDDDGAAPDPEEPAPGDGGPFPDAGDWGAVFPDMGADDIGFTGEPVGLRLEVVRLRASPTTERLYCYVHLALQPTVRYPDVDGDPTTDETFAPLGGDFWDTEPYLVGSPAPVVYWPDEEDLPFEVSCTGVADGGTDALDMGSFDIDIPPANWDGMLRDQTAVGSEGAYFVAYRVSRVTDLRDVPLYQDPDMAAPTNVVINDTSNTLSWDYLPGEYEEAITGFRIYLNGTLQWVVDAAARQSELPEEWLHPPCGGTYTFAVTAYRFDLPNGPESPPGEASISTPTEGEGCRVQIALNFQTLETYDLGGDGHYEDRTGDVGPPYGEFFANDWQATFDARPGGGWGGSLDTPMGLEHNTMYNLNDAAADSSWRFSMQPSTVVFLAEGQSLEFGYNIKDEDTGYCHDGDEPGCDDNICHGSLIITEGLDLPREGSILSTNGRCRVTYNYGPAPGSPAPGGAAGVVPLPWIDVEGVRVFETTNTTTTYVRNSGSASLTGYDLEIGFEYRNGTPIGVLAWNNLDLAAGQRHGLSTSSLTLAPPYDICVTIDPNDTILEYYEANGTRTHTRFCPLRPDLRINEVLYDPTGAGRIRVTVGNIGEASLGARTLVLRGTLPDGRSAGLFSSWPEVTIRPYEMRTFDFAGISEELHSLLEESGYSITVDPDNIIAEMDEENNTYNMTSTRLKVWWCDGFIPHYRGLASDARMFLKVENLRGTLAETIYEASRTNFLNTDETDLNHCFLEGCNPSFSCGESSPVFSTMGEEDLRVSVSADFQAGLFGPYDSLGRVSQTFTPAQNWGAFPAANEDDWGHSIYCKYFSRTPDVSWVTNEDPWFSFVCILQLPE